MLILKLAFVFSYAYMINNVILLITGTLRERDVSELIPKCHPLGMFDGIEALTTSTNPIELYQTVLIASPLGEMQTVVRVHNFDTPYTLMLSPLFFL